MTTCVVELVAAAAAELKLGIAYAELLVLVVAQKAAAFGAEALA